MNEDYPRYRSETAYPVGQIVYDSFGKLWIKHFEDGDNQWAHYYPPEKTAKGNQVGSLTL